MSDTGSIFDALGSDGGVPGVPPIPELSAAERIAHTQITADSAALIAAKVDQVRDEVLSLDEQIAAAEVDGNVALSIALKVQKQRGPVDVPVPPAEAPAPWRPVFPGERVETDPTAGSS